MKTTTKPAPAKVKSDYSKGDVQLLLHADHEKVDHLFFQFSQTDDKKEQTQLVKTILNELFLHTTVEEEIVYPAVRKQVDDSADMIDEADTEHHMIKLLMAELAKMKPGDDHFCSKVTVLGELVKHHVQEEEKEMFKEIQDSDIDAEKLGGELVARKEELKGKAMTALTADVNTARVTKAKTLK